MGKQVIVGVVIALATAAALWVIAKAGGFIEQVFIPELPGGAVVAFDGKCPTGWTPYEAGAGKFLLGAGTGTLRYRGPHQPENAPTEMSLTPVEHGDQGGAEQHKLTDLEMPQHWHEYQDAHPNRPEDGAKYDAGGHQDVRFSKNPVLKRTDSRGGNQAHNNMPPYIALYFCKKEG